MASTSKNYRYSISEIELNLTHSQERLASDSRLSTHAPLLEKASELPQSWPTSPRSVKLSSGTAIWNILVDITLLAFSAAFLIFALFVILYDGKPTSSHPQTAERFYQASHLGPTIYPILFASVVGRATHAILLWRLEKGERIGTLDILAGSTSFTNTVVSQFHLQMVSYVGLGLIAIWMLSPVGGQSSSRQITLGPSRILEDAKIYYIVPGPYMWSPDDPAIGLALESTYVAALLSPEAKNGSPRDAWGHVKIPRIEHYEGILEPGNDGWFNTTNGTLDSYSSLIGVPMSGINSADYIDYAVRIEAMYFHLDCDIFPWQDDGSFEFRQQSWLGYLYWNENTTTRAKLPANELNPFSFVWTDQDWSYSLNCSMVSTYVEVEVSCATYDTCVASRLRRTRLTPQPPNPAYTQLGLERDGNHTMWEIANTFTTPSLKYFSFNYLSNPENPHWMSGIGETPAENGTIRLEQMLNTYWGAMNSRGAALSESNGLTTWKDQNISWPYQDGSQDYRLYDESKDEHRKAVKGARTWPSTGRKRSNIKVFRAHYGWVIALIVSSSVLITASLIPFYMRTFLSNGPSILMNLSSLATRDNRYITLPATGTYLDAADRSRYLKDLRIRFGDAEEGNETGRLVIGRLDGDIASLKKGRKYA